MLLSTMPEPCVATILIMNRRSAVVPLGSVTKKRAFQPPRRRNTPAGRYADSSAKFKVLVPCGREGACRGDATPNQCLWRLEMVVTLFLRDCCYFVKKVIDGGDVGTHLSYKSISSLVVKRSALGSPKANQAHLLERRGSGGALGAPR